jgi:hypothetical protein
MMATNNVYVPGSSTDQTLVFKALVVSVPNSLTGYEPIKCRIQVSDSKILNDKDLPNCYPLLPKHLNVYPKEGEWVYILNINKDSNQQIRYFLGPVIDTFKNLPLNPNDNTETNSNIKPDLTQPEKGIYPNRGYISIQGRNNSDVVFKDQEVLLRAGKYVVNNPLKFNSLDTAYIQIKYGQPDLKETNKTQTKTEVKLVSPDGFAIASLTNVNGIFDWVVNIRVEDKGNAFLGRIYKTFTSENSAVSYIKETFLKLQKNDPSAISDIKDNLGNNITNIYDFSKFKYINDSIPQLKDFNINQSTEKVSKTETVKVTETIFDDSKGSAINIVANKVNLISYGNKDGFKLLDPDVTITPEQQIKINTEGHPVPYGDKLNEFLNLMKSFVSNHVHAYSGLPPDPDPIVEQILNYDLETILNQNVRTA